MRLIPGLGERGGLSVNRANERVTEIMFVFGQAPAGFAQVEKPQIKCTAIAGLTAGSSFVNIADVGGTYNGVWVQAIL